MAPHVLFQPQNGLNGLNPFQIHGSFEDQLLWKPEVASGVNSQPLTGQHPQHGYEGQFVREQLMMPQIPFQPRSTQDVHHDQSWFEEAEGPHMFREGHDHESQARIEDRETQFRREETQLSHPYWGQIQDPKDEQLDEMQKLQTWLEEQIEQQGNGNTLGPATRFVPQRSDEEQQYYQSPYDSHNFGAASSKVYFQQPPDQHGRQLKYQGTQRFDQERRQNEGRRLQMGSSHPEGRKRKGQPSDDVLASLQSNTDQSRLSPIRDYPPLAWAQDEEPNFGILPQQTAYDHPDQQGQQSSRIADSVPSSPPGMDSDSMSVWDFLPQPPAYGHPNYQGQQSGYISQSRQSDYSQQPIRYSTPPETQSQAAAPVPSSPPGMDFDSMSNYHLRVWNTAFGLPTDRSREDLIRQAKTGERIKVVKRSRHSQKNRNLEGLTAAANKHCSTCTCTEPAVSLNNLCSSACQTNNGREPY